MTPGAILYDRLGRRYVVLTGPVRGRYEVRRRNLIVWVAERDIVTWTATPPEKS